jgi:hypothetical protein
MYQISIFNALRLSQENIESLISGATTAAITPTSLDPNRTFALFSEDDDGKIKIQCWAICAFCQILDKDTPLEIIALHTNTSLEYLQTLLNKSERIILAYLRVYRLPTAIEIFSIAIGNFVQLSNSISVNNGLPLLSDRDFEIQKQRLLNLQPPESFFEKVKRKLEEVENLQHIKSKERTDWVGRIESVGNSSEGNDFEKLVRKGLIELGFSTTKYQDFLDPNKCGGAGGLDFYCDTPFAVVGECKATKSEKVPDGTAAQLVKLGFKHLRQEYYSCIKIIMAAGKLTEDAELTAIGNQMNVLRPETLQRLVELKLKYIGAINLLELKSCLEQEPHGEAADEKLNDFIEKVKYEIMVRSHIVDLVKNNHEERVGVETLFGAYPYSNPPRPIRDRQEMFEILIELSSPLAGYLGREKNAGINSDRFYYLRDLPI